MKIKNRSVLAIAFIGLAISANAAAGTVGLKDSKRIEEKTFALNNLPMLKTNALNTTQFKRQQPEFLDNEFSEEPEGQFQRRLISDKAVNKSAANEQQDNSPMQAILQDEELMGMIEDVDMSRLRGDPKFQALLNSPELQEMMKQLK